MKITVFTSNQPRHINLIKKLSDISDQVYAIQECNTIFPGQVKDFFKKSDIMQEYFSKMMISEKNIFGDISFLPSNVNSLSIKMGDLSKISIKTLSDALKSDIYIIFGSSFIKGDLIDFLIEKKAFNIHMGVSPYFRGSSCNFWASYMEKFDFVGSTIHMLSKKLDAGDMLYHALPKAQEIDAFDLGMQAVSIAHDSIVDRIKSGEIFNLKTVMQNKEKEIKYSVNAEFTDEIAKKYIDSFPSDKKVFDILLKRDESMFLNPYIK